MRGGTQRRPTTDWVHRRLRGRPHRPKLPARGRNGSSTVFGDQKRSRHNVNFSVIVLGLISGFIASKLVNKTGEGMLMDIVLGRGWRCCRGWLFHTFGMPGVTGLNLYSLLVASWVPRYF